MNPCFLHWHGFCFKLNKQTTDGVSHARKQAGFTLIEIAIVLVIIGLLLGGVLKGQELINSAKVKNLAQDFRNTPLFIYGYQDKFKALPGDDANVTSHVTGGTLGTGGTAGNGVIEGAWDASSGTGESYVFWQHVRLAGLAVGPTVTTDATYAPRNADGGRIGIQSNSGFTTITGGITGTYVICSDAILGKFVKQLDVTMDDGNTATGAMRAVVSGTPGAAVATTAIVDGSSYTVCMGI